MTEKSSLIVLPGRLAAPPAPAALRARAIAALHGGVGVYDRSWPRGVAPARVQSWVLAVIRRRCGIDPDISVVVLSERTRRRWRPVWCGAIADPDAWNRAAAAALAALSGRRPCAATVFRFGEAVLHALRVPPSA